jgi:hypothetical protein
MVEFVSYTGTYPNLCSGVLTVKIDGKEVVFGVDYLQDWRKRIEEPDYNMRFWYSGGGLTQDYCAYQCPWRINEDDLKPEYKSYAQELIDCFNENVPYGCCGGCI